MDKDALGLHLYDPQRDAKLRHSLTAELQARVIPFEGFTETAAAPEALQLSHTLTFDSTESMLRLFALQVMSVGNTLPADQLLHALTAARDARAGNVLRRWVLLQVSLAPYLLGVTPIWDDMRPETQFFLGKDLLVSPVLNAEGTVETVFPAGVWTSLLDGTVRRGGVMRSMHGVNTMPIFARENAVIPIAACDRRVRSVYADQVTLHWFEPREEATCRLPDGEAWRLRYHDGKLDAETNSVLPWHLIVHADGEERLIR